MHVGEKYSDGGKGGEGLQVNPNLPISWWSHVYVWWAAHPEFLWRKYSRKKKTLFSLSQFNHAKYICMYSKHPNLSIMYIRTN